MKFLHYQIENELGKSSCSTLYCAVDLTCNEKVVVRVYAKMLSNNRRFRVAFKAIYAKLMKVQHAHLARVLYAGVDNGRCFSVTEYFPSGDIQQQLLTPEQILHNCLNVAQALSALHDVGLVHCGICPSRMLFNDRGEIKLGEIDITKLFIFQTQDIEAAKTAKIPFADAPPEIFFGKKINHRSDYYQLGLALYTLLTGQPAFPEQHFDAWRAMHAKGVTPQLPQVLHELQPVLDQLLAPAPEHRIATSKQLANVIHHITQSEQQAPATPQSRLTGWVAASVLCVCCALMYWAVLKMTTEIVVTAQSDATPASSTRQIDTPTSNTDKPHAQQHDDADLGAGVRKWRRAQQLLKQAQEQMDTLKLSLPIGDNAYETYEKLSALFPSERWAADGFEAIAEKYLEIAREQLNTGHLEQAIYLTSLGIEVKPNHRSLQFFSEFLSREKRQLLDEEQKKRAQVDAELAIAQQEQAQNRQVIRRLLQRIETQVAAYKLTSPKGDNAVESYQRIQQLDPQNPIVREGFNRVAKIYLALAALQLSENDIDKSQAMLDKGLKLVASHPDLTAFQAKIEAKKQENVRQTKKIKRLYATVRAQFKQQKLLSPKEDNVFETLQTMQVIAPNHPLVRKSFDEIASRFLQQAKSETDPKQFGRMLSMVNLGVSLMPKHTGLAAFKEELEATLLIDRNRSKEQSNTEKQITRLHTKVKKQIVAGRLLQPENNNAFHTYAVLVQIAPQHDRVLAIRSEILAYTIARAKQLQEQGSLDLALDHIDQLLKVSPRHTAGRRLKSQLNRQREELSRIKSAKRQSHAVPLKTSQAISDDESTRVFGTL